MDAAVPRFTSRQQRGLAALMAGPVMREELDRAAGVSNGPQLVRELRGKGVSIETEEVPVLDRDGKVARSGRYSLTGRGRESLRSWGYPA